MYYIYLENNNSKFKKYFKAQANFILNVDTCGRRLCPL
jgi:hypothetical protein